jgi:hypothetical protein
MRWPIVRLIWLRELRDQLRDRRTLFMIAGLPLLLYPVLGFAVLQFAVGFVQKPSTIGLVSGPFRSRDFPPRAPAALPACLALAPAAPPGAGLPPNQTAWPTVRRASPSSPGNSARPRRREPNPA